MSYSFCFENLIEPVDQPEIPADFSPNADYERYLKMHKVFVGKRGARQLEAIYDSLKLESMPRFLSAAGWAAAEAALVNDDHTSSRRLEMLEGAEDCWERSLEGQMALNESNKDHLTEYSQPYRTAVDLAVIPLFRELVEGSVSTDTQREVFENCLNIAQLNAIRINLAKRENNIDALGEHVGLGYELNALLAFNRQFSETWFAIPSMVRSDTGYYHRHQTHDLIVVHQKWGQLKSLTPVEIKASTSRRDRDRYKALLVRGKMHLSVDGKYRPEETLNAITSSYEGMATQNEMKIADNITERFTAMVRSYYSGEKMGQLATLRSLLTFRETAPASQLAAA